MRVHDVMKSEPSVCRPQQTLADAGRLMSRIGCGALPITDRKGVLVGILTDRDVCGALAGAGVAPGEMTVAQAMTPEVFTCAADDEIEDALEVMKEHRVRRLPVVDEENEVLAILSLDDVALAAHASAEDASALTWAQIGETLQAISQHPVLARVS